MYQKQYQNKKDGKAQYEMVEDLDGITGDEGKFIERSDVIDSTWDSPESFQAAIVSDNFMISHRVLMVTLDVICCV